MEKPLEAHTEEIQEYMSGISHHKAVKMCLCENTRAAVNLVVIPGTCYMQLPEPGVSLFEVSC